MLTIFVDNHTKCCCKAAAYSYAQKIDSQYIAFYIHLASWLLPVSQLAICFIHFTCLLVQKLWGNNLNKWGTQVSTGASLAIVVLFLMGRNFTTLGIGHFSHWSFLAPLHLRPWNSHPQLHRRFYIGHLPRASWPVCGWHIKTEPALKQIGQFFHLASIRNLPFITAKNAGSRTDQINPCHTNFKNRSKNDSAKKENQLRIFS